MEQRTGIPKKLYSADIEADDLDATLIWVTSITELNPETFTPISSYSLTKKEDIAEKVSDPDVCWIFHNGHSFDRPTLDRLITTFEGELIDTLALSWYLYPKKNRHGLAYWGEEFGIPKPEVEDWKEQPIEVYINRCEEDVKIQTKLVRQMWKHLNILYNKNVEQIWFVMRYLSDKMYALAIAEKSRWKLDLPEAIKLEVIFQKDFGIAKVALEEGMPQVPVMDKKSKPKKCFKKDGSLSSYGQKWKEFTEEHGYEFEHYEDITYQKGWKDPNASSYFQLKSWLSDLGWKPQTFEYKRDKETGKVRMIPQLKIKDTGELCPSIERMIKDTPSLEHLRTMGIVKHRISVVGGFIKNVDSEGYIVAGAQGFTNTLRLRHKVVLNIPSVRKLYGKEIRGLLQARSPTFELLGSDQSSLEDRTKQHYMWPHDPDYVKDMQRPDFDPHCDMAVEAGMMTKEEALEYADLNISDKRKHELSLIRYAGKTTNYAATYGAAGETIARAAGVTANVGEILHQAYWSRNWSLKAIADECIVKESRGMKWIWNPVAKIWYHLKADKDRFSTLNQGTGSFLFDQWVAYILRKRPQINGQFHDEVILEVRKGYREQASRLLHEAEEYVNETFKLNRRLDIDIAFGMNYAEIH